MMMMVMMINDDDDDGDGDDDGDKGHLKNNHLTRVTLGTPILNTSSRHGLE